MPIFSDAKKYGIIIPYLRLLIDFERNVIRTQSIYHKAEILLRVSEQENSTVKTHYVAGLEKTSEQ